MLDARLRRLTGPTLARAGAALARRGIRPGWVTAAGWVVGLGACVAAGARLWPAALGLWLGNRLLDGLDGAVARAGTPTDRGGFLDVVADFSIYGGFVAGVAVGLPAARLACVVLLLTYYASGTAFLALSSLLERRADVPGDQRSRLERRPGRRGDERSLRFVGGLAEGTETIAVYVLVCLRPADAAPIAWVFAAAVAVTAVQRVRLGVILLGEDPAAGRDGPGLPAALTERRGPAPGAGWRAAGGSRPAAGGRRARR